MLAIESDPRQASILRRVVKEHVRAELVVVDSKDAALAALGVRVPDLILVSALLPPRDEDELNEHLRLLDRASHLQTLTIPLLGNPQQQAPLRARVLGAFRRKRQEQAIDGCDPAVFADQIQEYLKRAEELRSEEPVAPPDEEVKATPAQEIAALPADESLEAAAVECAAEELLAPDLPAEVIQDAAPADVVNELSRAAIVEDTAPPEVVDEAAPAEIVGDAAPAEAVSNENRVLGFVAPSDIQPIAAALMPLAAMLAVPLSMSPARRWLLPDEPPSETVSQADALQPAEETAPAGDGSGVSQAATAEIGQADLDMALWDRLFGALEERFKEVTGESDPPPAAPGNGDGAGEGSATPDVAAPRKKLARRRRTRAAEADDSRSAGEASRKLPERPEEWRRMATALDSLRVEIEQLRIESHARRVEATADSDERHSAEEATGDGRPVPVATSSPAAAPDGVQDEWGFYDPDQCGMAALIARLKTDDPSKGRNKRPRVPTASETNGTSEDSSNGDPALARLTPLAVWARSDGKTDPQPSTQSTANAPGPPEDLPALMAGLRVPEDVANVQYASGCRIRRVRVKERPSEPPADKQVIILSRKALRGGG